MYLHIGKDCIIKNSDIIGIFNLKYIGNTKEYKNLYKRLNDEKKIFNISERKINSIILTQTENKEKAYFTNIGVYTISKRLI